MNNDSIQNNDFDKIKKALESGDYSLAEELIIHSKKQFPRDVGVYILEGELYLCTKRPKDAVDCIEKGLALDSSDYELYFILGEAYELLGKHKLAELYYRYAAYQCHNRDDLIYLNQNIERFLQVSANSLPGLSIFIPVGQNADWLKLFLKMLALYAQKDRYELLFLKSNPSDELCKWLDRQTLGKVISCADGEHSRLYNLAIEASDPYSDLVLIEEGELPLEHTLCTLQAELYQDEDTAAAGSISNHPAYASYMKSTSPCIEDAMRYAHRFNIPSHASHQNVLDLSDTILMIKRSMIKQYGWFDEAFKKPYYQKRDLFFRFINNNRNIKLCLNSLALTTAVKPFTWVPEELDLFYKKWRINLAYSCFSRTDLLQLIKIGGGPTLRILEIGCACGATLIEIGQRFPGSELHGIELDEGPASIAKHFAAIKNNNIETSDMNYPENFFDYIILGDVLEHLHRPELVLQNIKKYLKGDGHILVSIPNVMHMSVIKPLLGGYWTYENAGILDRTHLKFFTYQEILLMFERTGYRVSEIRATTIPLSEEDLQLAKTLATIRNVPEVWFEAYQYLLCADCGRKESL